MVHVIEERRNKYMYMYRAIEPQHLYLIHAKAQAQAHLRVGGNDLAGLGVLQQGLVGDGAGAVAAIADLGNDALADGASHAVIAADDQSGEGPAHRHRDEDEDHQSQLEVAPQRRDGPLQEGLAAQELDGLLRGEAGAVRVHLPGLLLLGVEISLVRRVVQGRNDGEAAGACGAFRNSTCNSRPRAGSTLRLGTAATFQIVRLASASLELRRHHAS